MGLMDGKAINVNDLPDTDNVMDNTYEVAISGVALKTEKKDASKGFLSIEYKITEGEFAGRVIYDSYVKDGGADFKKLLKAVNVSKTDAKNVKGDLLGKELRITTKIVVKDGQERVNIIARETLEVIA